MVDAAAAASRAFPAWSRAIPGKRADLLDRIGQRIAQERNFLGAEAGEPAVQIAANAASTASPSLSTISVSWEDDTLYGGARIT